MPIAIEDKAGMARFMRARLSDGQQSFFTRVFVNGEPRAEVLAEMGLPSDYEEDMLRDLRDQKEA